MTSITTKPDSLQPAAEMAVDLFDNWFDPCSKIYSVSESVCRQCSPARPGFSARAGPHRYSLAQAILPIGLPAAGGRRDCLDAVCKLHTCDHLWQLVVALESSPAILRRLGELEDHGERGLVRFVANSKLTQNHPLLGCPGADQMQRRGLGRTVKGAPQCLPVNRDGTQAGLGKAGSGSV